MTEEAQKLRNQLIHEADLLQRLTDPMCQNKALMHSLMRDMLDENLPSPLQMQLQNTVEEIQKEARDQMQKDWNVSNEEFVARFETTIRENADLFPLLNKYYTFSEA